MLLATVIVAGLALVLGVHTYTFLSKVQIGGVDAMTEQSVSVTAGSSLLIDESVPAPSTNLEFAFACDVSQLKGLAILTDQTLTIYTNEASTGSPAQTIVVTANVPIVWHSTSGLTNPLTTDVTKIFVTKAAGTAARLRIWKLEDPTV